MLNFPFICSDRCLTNLKGSDFPRADNCVLYIARYLPLVTPAARDVIYKSLHPYAARSDKEFRSWNLGKQLASEVN